MPCRRSTTAADLHAPAVPQQVGLAPGRRVARRQGRNGGDPQAATNCKAFRGRQSLHGRALFDAPALTFEELRKATDFFNPHKFNPQKPEDGGRLLGSGTDADVFYADSLRGAEVAVKCIKPKASARATAAELRVLDVCHDHVLPIWGMLREEGFTYLVLPLMECSLYDALEYPTKLSAPQRLMVARDIAAGLAALHGQQPAILHRDLKPGNVLLHRPDGGTWRARIADFGRSRTLTEGRMHATTNVTGTKCFICPEYYATDKARPSSDVYSLGFILLQLVTGMSWKDVTAQGGGLVEAKRERLYNKDGQLKTPLYEPKPTVRNALWHGAAAVPTVLEVAEKHKLKWTTPECKELWRLADLCLRSCYCERPKARYVCAALQELLTPGVPPLDVDVLEPADHDVVEDVPGAAGSHPPTEEPEELDSAGGVAPMDAFAAAFAQAPGGLMDADGAGC